MPAGRPAAPLAKLKASGTIDKNPGRYKDRKEPQSKPIGKPSRSLKKREIEAWHAFVYEAPWIREGDRRLLEMACKLTALLWADRADNDDMRLLLSLLSKMGMTPTDRSRVLIAQDDKAKDPSEAFFN